MSAVLSVQICSAQSELYGMHCNAKQSNRPIFPARRSARRSRSNKTIDLNFTLPRIGPRSSREFWQRRRKRWRKPCSPLFSAPKKTPSFIFLKRSCHGAPRALAFARSFDKMRATVAAAAAAKKVEGRLRRLLCIKGCNFFSTQRELSRRRQRSAFDSLPSPPLPSRLNFLSSFLMRVMHMSQGLSPDHGSLRFFNAPRAQNSVDFASPPRSVKAYCENFQTTAGRPKVRISLLGAAAATDLFNPLISRIIFSFDLAFLLTCRESVWHFMTYKFPRRKFPDFFPGIFLAGCRPPSVTRWYNAVR